MLLIETEDGITGVTLSDLSNEEVFEWCGEARDDYIAAIETEDTNWEQMSWDAVRMLGLEAKKRGILPGWVH